MPPWSAYGRTPRPTGPSGTPTRRESRPAQPAVSSSHLPLTPDPTPPSSLPVSTPGSPVALEDTAQLHPRFDSVRARLAADDMPGPHPVAARWGKRSKHSDGSYRMAEVAGASDYTNAADQALPQAGPSGAFSPRPGPDERPRLPAGGGSGSHARESMSGRAAGKWAAAQTTTATTSTRKTERRQVRYSLPALEDHLDAAIAPWSHSRVRSSSTGSSRARSPAPHRRASVPLAGRTRRSSVKTDKPPPPKAQRWRHSPAYGTPATSSPFFRRSSSASNYAVQRRQSGDAYALLPTGSLPFFRPLVNAFAFLVVSAVAAVAISTVLAASFSLTFYDDCTRRIGYAQRSLGGSIEGVRAGMGRVIGNARGALDLAVRAAGGNKVELNPTAGVDDEDADRSRTSIPTVRVESDHELSDIELGGWVADTSRAKRERSACAQTDSGASSPSQTKRRRSIFRQSPQVFTPFTGSGNTTPREYADAEGVRTPASTSTGWRTDDEDASFQFNVPNSTPRSSRTASPQRDRMPRSHRPGDGGGGSRTNALPPRPPLAVLIPSILLALLFTLAKVIYQAWKVRSTGTARRGQPRRRGPET
ncbi:hypothetical protein JCM3770_003452 [Rhodotorula araucariae]